MMHGPEIDLLGIDRGTVTAPAGCGKTYLIAEALSRHENSKPVLVLTHTNAGVSALRGRLHRAGVSPSAYRLSTIDGWAMRLISTFPTRTGHDAEILNVKRPGTDYPKIRLAAAGLLEAGHISDILAASYARLIVDEYQDCSLNQHAVITHAAATLATCVLGDPLQAIFGFGSDGLPKWDDEVCQCFPVAGELTKPWRWVNANAQELGNWLLKVRRMLLNGEKIDLCAAPPAVTWVELDGHEDHKRRLAAARVRPPGGKGHVLIIGDSTNPENQRQFASCTPGAVMVEAVDLKDLISFARNFCPAAPDALSCVAGFAKSVMTNVGAADLIRRAQSLARGTARKPPTDVENNALEFIQAPSYRFAGDLLAKIAAQGGVRTYRPTVLRACVKALRLCGGPDGPTFHDAVIRFREQYRFSGRPLPKRAVGSTLLMKGLEAEAAVILNAHVLNSRNLYVAMTRGSKSLTVCSRSRFLNENQPSLIGVPSEGDSL